MHDSTYALATDPALRVPVARRVGRLRAALVSAALVATALGWPAAAAAADNLAPVAVDDPGTPCTGMPGGAFGGAFPIPEDWGRFDFVGPCSAIANDSDPDGSIVGWEIVSQPAHGSLEYLASYPGIFGYTARPDFSTAAGDWVSDSFTYRVIDNLGAVSNVATMRFWIAPINDAPRFLSVPTVTVEENSGAYDVSWLPYVSAGPSNESNQTIEFITTAGEFQGVAFTDPPTFTADGRLTFTPAPNTHGYARITVYLKDNGGLDGWVPSPPVPPDDTSDPVTFTIFVNESNPNANPVAVGDTVIVAEDSGVTTINVLANDSDSDGDPFGVVAVSQGAKGSVAITGGGTAVTYTTTANANGADSFSYTISDGNGGVATATVSVTITPVNDPPIATKDVATVDEDSGANRIEVLANDRDIDGGTLRVTQTTDGTKGTAAIIGDGPAVTYTPDPDANGFDVFTYTVSDGNGGTDTVAVHVTINAVNDPPDAIDDGVPTPIRIARGSGPVSIAVLANDTSTQDGAEVLHVTGVTQGSSGAVAIAPDGLSLTYDPAGQTTGLDTFTYTIGDGNGGFDTATVHVEVVKVKGPR